MADLQIKLSVTNAEAFQRALASAADELQETLKDAISDLRDEIEETTTTLVPVDTGALRDSINIELTDNGYGIHAEATMDYASFVDKGTRKMSAEPYFEEPITEAFTRFEDEIDDKITTSLQDI